MWHKGGMLAAKQNCFDDFQTAAEFLIEKKYTSPKRFLSCACVHWEVLLVKNSLVEPVFEIFSI